MVTGRSVQKYDQESISLEGENTEVVDEFPYLGSQIVRLGRMDVDFGRWIAQASITFGACRKAVFMENLSKKRIYILSVCCLC